MMQGDETKATMSEIYAEFDDNDNLEGNDEDIGALGSILSWDEDDDEAVGISVAATSSALEAREGDCGLPSSVSYSKEGESSYLPELGGANSNSNNVSNFQIPIPGFNSAQPVAQQPQPVPLQPQSVPLVQPQHTQQQQVMASAPGSQPQVMFYQMPSTFQGGPDQQQTMTLPSGITLAALPRPATVQQQPGAEQQTFNLADPNALLRQVQAAQVQQQFNALQQARPLAPQPAPIMPTLPQPQQTQQILTNNQSNNGTVPQMQKKRPTHKPVKPVLPQPAVSSTQPLQQPTAVARGTNIVSCSDTDGEASMKTTGASTSSGSKTEKKKAGASQSSSNKAKTGNTSEKGEVDTSNMSASEKAKANRDRNREHARNTRLRKKAYLEKLKMTVDELCRERDTLVSERAGAANLLVEMHNTRTEVLMSFFALRSAYEKRRELWASILDESCFACVMPVTPYRSFPASEVQVSKCQRTILGIDGMMADTASLHVLLNSLIDRKRYPNGSIAFRYTLVTEDAVVAGNQMMARWVMTTLNATQCGARMEVAKQGMLCCKFNSAHKIIGLELMFDVMAFMLQLKQAAGSESFSVVPNTVQTCQRSFDSPMVMTLAERPYTIVQVNKLWEDMTGFKAEDVVGKASCRILQGQETDRSKVEDLMYSVRFKRPASCVLLNYSSTGKRFRNHMNVYPLSTDSKVTHYVALTVHVEKIDGAVSSSPADAVHAPKVLASHAMSLPQNQVCAPSSAQVLPQGSTVQQPGRGQIQQVAPQTLVMPGQLPDVAGAKAIQAPPGTLPNASGASFFMPPPILSSAPASMPAPSVVQIVPPIAITDASTAASVTAATSNINIQTSENKKRPLDNASKQDVCQRRRT